MIDKTFCEIYNSFFGDEIDKAKQINSVSFDGRQLKEFVLHVLECAGKSPRDVINYIESDSEIAIPINDLFDEYGKVLTKKKYGHLILKILVQELKDKFLKDETL